MLAAIAFYVLARGDTNVTVLAAASLKKPLGDLEKTFETRNPGTRLQISYAGSQELATQLTLGAPADVFFSADRAQIDVVVKAKRIDKREVKPFAGNRLCLLVAAKSQNRVHSLADLTQGGIRICLAGDRVPVGAYANQMLANAAKKFGPTWLDKVRTNVVSFETNVSAIVTRVELGEVDAGIVYESDAKAAKTAIGFEIPKDVNVRATYYLGVISDAPNPKAARDFVALTLSKEGQAVFAKYGFLAAK